MPNEARRKVAACALLAARSTGPIPHNAAADQFKIEVYCGGATLPSRRNTILNTLPILAAALAFATLAGPAFATDGTESANYDAAAGEAIYKKDCRACHGPTAKGVSSYPKLVDHPFEYLVDRLERYRAGEKFGPNTMLMAPRAKALSDDDIGNVAAFITSIE